MVGVGAAIVMGLVAPVAGAASTANATDKQIATAGVLVASDFPATYTQSARDTSSDAQTDKQAAKVAACKKLVAFMKAVKQNTEMKSPEFNSGQTQIDNTVTVFPTAAKAKAAVDTYSASGLPACFGQLVGKLAQQAGGKATADIKKVQDVTAGDQAVAYEGPVQITESDGTQTTLGVRQPRDPRRARRGGVLVQPRREHQHRDRSEERGVELGWTVGAGARERLTPSSLRSAFLRLRSRCEVISPRRSRRRVHPGVVPAA